MLNTLQPNKVNNADDLGKFIRKCKVLLPNTNKTRYSEHNTFDQIDYTIEDRVRLHFHNHLKDSKKDFWKRYSVSLYSRKEKHYKEAFSLIYPKQVGGGFTLETFTNGYGRTKIEPEHSYWNDDHNSFEVITTGKYKVFMVRKDDEMTHIGIMNSGLLVKFYEIKGDKAINHFPITNVDSDQLSHKVFYFGFGSVAYVVATVLYFQSIFMSFFIIAFAWGALAVNDAVNPRRHPVINIIQAVIYAVIFFFLR